MLSLLIDPANEWYTATSSIRDAFVDCNGCTRAANPGYAESRELSADVHSLYLVGEVMVMPSKN